MDVPAAVAPPPWPAVRVLMHRAAFWAVLGLAAVVVGVGGLAVRRWAWDQTEPIRFLADIDNAFRQGTRTLAVGYVERYDNERVEPQHAWVMGLDYGPGRLAVAALWARWVREHVTAPSVGPDPRTDQWYPEFYTRARQLKLTYDLCRPLLMLNLTGEALAAAAMFLLVRRYASERGTRPARGAVLALVAASLFWLDPALIWNAHCWPQWDSWVLPFLLWAILLASVNLWFCAGVVMAAGAMFKGQILFGGAVFLLWPLWQGRLGAMGRWTAGLASGAAAATGVWLLRTPGGMVGFLYVPGHTNPAAVQWVLSATVAACLVLVAVRARGAWVERVTPLGWAGWTERDPSGGRIAAGVGAMVAAVIGAAAAVAIGVWLAAVSIGLGLIGFAVALALLAWTGWTAGIVPPAWPRRLAGLPIGWSVAARGVVGALAVIAVMRPLRRAGVAPLWPAVVGVVGFAALVWAVPRRSLGHALAAWVAAALLLCVPLFGDSDQWYYTGIAHGTTARNIMSVGENNNLANLLGEVWHWDLEDPVVTLPPGRVANGVAAFLESVDRHAPVRRGRPVGLPLKYLLLLIWVTVTIGCSMAAARHDRRRDARFLLAMAAPWVAMFAVMGQMHQRYLLWGAALTCMAAAVSPGLVLLHLLLSVVSMGQEMLSMMNRGQQDTLAYQVVRGWTPGMGWGVLVAAGVFVYAAVAPGRRRRPERGTGRPITGPGRA